MEYLVEQNISKEEALKRLYSGAEHRKRSNDIFDRFGNYNFPFEKKTCNISIGNIDNIYFDMSNIDNMQ